MTPKQATRREHWHVRWPDGVIGQTPYRTAVAARGDMTIGGNAIEGFRVVKIHAGGNCPCQSSGDTGKKGESRTGRRHTRRSSAAAPKDSTPLRSRPERVSRHGLNQQAGASITPQQEAAHLNFLSRGDYAG